MASFIIGFICLFLVIEAVAAFISIDAYGEHLFASFIIAGVIFGIGYVANDISDTTEENSEQVNQLAEQMEGMDDQVQQQQAQFEDIFDDLLPDIEQAVVEERPREPVVTIEYNQLRTDQQVVPSNTAYIDTNRRNRTETVLYNSVTRQGCIDDNCFKANLVQHTDGTFWACKRNYGMCYQYE